jgi:hypothetical protein
LADRVAGSLVVELRADSSKLDAGLAEAQGKVEAAAEKASASTGSKFGTALSRAGGTLTQFATGIPVIGSLINGLGGPISAVVGAVTGLLVLYDRWHEKQLAVNKAMQDLVRETEALRNASAASLSKVAESGFDPGSKRFHEERLKQIDLESNAELGSIHDAAEAKYQSMVKEGTDTQAATKIIFDTRAQLEADAINKANGRRNQEEVRYAKERDKAREEEDRTRSQREKQARDDAAKADKEAADEQERADKAAQEEIDRAEVYQAQRMQATWMEEVRLAKEAAEIRERSAERFAAIMRGAAADTTNALNSLNSALGNDRIASGLVGIQSTLEAILANGQAAQFNQNLANQGFTP